MNPPGLDLEPTQTSAPFTAEQKEYLAGFMAGIAQRQLFPNSGPQSNSPASQTTVSHSEIASPPESRVHGTALSDLCKQELWKHELHGLDTWDRLLEHA